MWDDWPFGVAHWLGAIPVLWLVGRREQDVRWWWIGLGYAVSFLADSLSHWAPHPLIYNAYPLSQAGLILVALTPRFAPRLTIGLTVIGCLSIVTLGVPNLWALHLAAWGLVAVIGWRCTEWLRLALVMSFGIGLVAWSLTQLSPGWPAWIAFQSTRLLGTLALCVAMTVPFPSCAPRTP